jgi:hypothetical protein
VPKDSDRSLARIEVADLLRLAALAADAEAELFKRNPQGSGRYAGRLLGSSLTLTGLIRAAGLRSLSPSYVGVSLEKAA